MITSDKSAPNSTALITIHRDFDQALAKSRVTEPKIPIGLFYETQKPTYEEQDPALKFGNPVKAKLGVTDPNQLLQEFY